MSALPVVNQIRMPSLDAKRLEALIYQEMHATPSDFDTGADRTNYMYLYKLLNSEKPFTAKQKQKLSDMLGVNAFELFRHGDTTTVKGNRNTTATGGSVITSGDLERMDAELKKLKQENETLKQKYIKLLEKLALNED